MASAGPRVSAGSSLLKRGRRKKQSRPPQQGPDISCQPRDRLVLALPAEFGQPYLKVSSFENGICNHRPFRRPDRDLSRLNIQHNCPAALVN